MPFIKTTEQDSKYNNLENMSILDVLTSINNEDKTVAYAVERAIPQITELTNSIICQLKKGGRLFYIGAGTSGRLGVLDASECPPTFGVSHDLVIGLIAGGDKAIRNAVEYSEDSISKGWEDLKEFLITQNDIVIGIAASGTTPYVIAALEKCNKESIITGCITCNRNSPLSKVAKLPIEIIVGSEFVTGSSRMKAGTAQKMVLNMISTTTMIQLGKIRGNKMVDMQLSNKKLVERGENMLIEELKVDKDTASLLLKKYGNVRDAIKHFNL